MLEPEVKHLLDAPKGLRLLTTQGRGPTFRHDVPRAAQAYRDCGDDLTLLLTLAAPQLALAEVIYGTASSEELNGGPNADVIWAYGGNDDVHGRGGNDDLHLGAGVDTGHGADGADEIWGGGLIDYMWGGNGADNLYDVENQDEDYFYGGLDNDYINMQDGSSAIDWGYGQGGPNDTRSKDPPDYWSQD